MNEIVIKPPSILRSVRDFICTVVIFTAIGFVGVMVVALFLMFYFAGPAYQLPGKFRIPAMIAGMAPGFLFSLQFAKKMLNKQYWRLTDTELSCGIYGQKIFPLDSIDKIIVGLPVRAVEKLFQQAEPGTATEFVMASSVRGWETKRSQVLASMKSGILICFKDNSCLPLRLVLLPNGDVIIDELKERFKDRLVHNYTYSPEQTKRLERRDPNERVPPPKCPEEGF